MDLQEPLLRLLNALVVLCPVESEAAATCALRESAQPMECLATDTDLHRMVVRS